MLDISPAELQVGKFSPFLSLETSPSIDSFCYTVQVPDEIPAKYLRNDREYY